MNDDIDDGIDRLLRAAAPDPVADEGFCARLAETLPPRRRRTIWPLAAGIVAGIVACWITMGSAQVTQAGWQDWLAGDVTPSALALLAAAAGLCLLALAGRSPRRKIRPCSIAHCHFAEGRFAVGFDLQHAAHELKNAALCCRGEALAAADPEPVVQVRQDERLVPPAAAVPFSGSRNGSAPDRDPSRLASRHDPGCTREFFRMCRRGAKSGEAHQQHVTEPVCGQLA